MQIGDLKLENPVFLAPMAGITDLPFRRIVKNMGCGMVYSEMISAKGLVYDNKKSEKLLAISEGEKPIAMQVFGREEDILSQAVKIIAEKGPDVIDFNLGCPAPKVVKSGYGSALMKEPKQVNKVVRAMTETVDIPITVKIRTGWDRDNINAVEVAKAAEFAGAKAVAVHGRSREEFYSGQADWSIIQDVVNAVSIPVIGNGDIFTPDDAERILAETDCDGIMIGRAARGNPWIFKRVAHYLKTNELLPPPKPSEKIDMALIHLENLVDFKGEYIGIREMRKHAAWYIKGLRNCSHIKDELNTSESMAEMKKILIEYRKELNKSD